MFIPTRNFEKKVIWRAEAVKAFLAAGDFSMIFCGKGAGNTLEQNYLKTDCNQAESGTESYI